MLCKRRGKLIIEVYIVSQSRGQTEIEGRRVNKKNRIDV